MTTSMSGGGDGVTGGLDTEDDSWLADQARDALSAIATLHEQAKTTLARVGQSGEPAKQDTDGPADTADAKPVAAGTDDTRTGEPEADKGSFTEKADPVEAPGGQSPSNEAPHCTQ